MMMMAYGEKMENTTKAIQFDKRKAMIAAVPAAIGMLGCIWYQDMIIGLISLMFIAVGFIKISVKHVWVECLLYSVWVYAVLTVTVHAPEQIMNVADQMQMTADKLILNYVFIFIVCSVIFLITNKLMLSVISGTFVLMILVTANCLIYRFRGKELTYFDLMSVRTALNVMGSYKVSITPEMIRCWMSWILAVFAGFALPRTAILCRVGKLRVRTIEAAFIAVLMFGFFAVSAKIPVKTWDNEGTRLNGYYLNFYLGIRDFSVKEPQKYSIENIEKQIEKYLVSQSGDDIQGESLPNIIVIMDESYSDLRVLGNINTNRQVTPFIDSLKENTVRGYALTSVYGGNTANAEFEFLTGHSMAFFPNNCVPYQQYIKQQTDTLAWHLRSYGYRSFATHPYWSNGWSRNKVYPHFGFEESTFIEEYNDLQYPVRNYISDRDMFEYVLRILNSDNDERPLFLFGVTMQNHGGYDYSDDNYENVIKLEGYDRDFPLAEQFLSLIYETDRAVEYLITELENNPEKTIVLFFGDHFPKLDTVVYEDIFAASFETLSQQMRLNLVPFFIWANYDIDEAFIECTSLNYLSKHLMETAGLPLSPYQRFLSDVQEVIPAINANGYYSLDKNDFVLLNNATGEEKEWLERYNCLVYNDLFDIKNHSSIFLK